MSTVAVREISTPATIEIDDSFTLARLLEERATEAPDAPFGEYRGADEAWVSVTRGQFRDDVRALAKGLLASGVRPGDTVGLMGSTRYEWAVCDFAILTTGALTVPVYPTSSAHQLEWIHRDARLALLIVESPEQAALAASFADAPRTAVINDGGLAELRDAGTAISEAQLDAARDMARADDVATIVYTSGTTGRPKGVQLTHRNFVQHAVNAADHPDYGLLAKGDTRLLLFLPLAHVFARFAMVLGLHIGSTIGFAPSIKTLAADLQHLKPTWLIGVPRVLESVYNTADATAGGATKQRIFRWAAGVARKMSHARTSGRAPSLALRAQARIADALVWGRVREVMGGHLQYLVLGGAKVSPRIGQFFDGIGMTVMEGYGATELSAPHTCNPPSATRIGTVGIPFPGCSVRIADDGEILTAGANVFAGYRGMPDATAEVLVDGWYRTGDLGEITPEGHLVITGRKKEILVTTTGKNVQPAGLEDAIRPYPLVQEVVVVGDGRPFVSALIAFDETMLPTWLTSKGLPLMSAAEAAIHPVVREHLQSVIDQANALVSRAEAIRAWQVLPRELSEAREELSASLKVRRQKVIDHFTDVIDSIYGDRVQGA